MGHLTERTFRRGLARPRPWAWLACLALGIGASHAGAKAGSAAGTEPQAAAPQEGATTRRSIAAVRFPTPPTIDGDLSDPCWQQAAKADRWVDWLNGNTDIDQTVAYLGFDDQNFYLAFYAYDSQPQGIVARQTKRGAFPSGDDFVDLNLDPFHTHKWNDVSFFFLNALGTQYARLGGGRATKLEWEGKWQAASKIVADGWTAEMAIPWSILNYPDVKGPTTCGINFLRLQKRTNILSNWSNIGPDDQHPELAGHWVGVEFPPFRPQLSLLPFAAPGWEEHRGEGLRTGVDLRATLTPSLTLAGTINPDFESVEGAVEGIDFSYGPRFVPDRRPFFQEGSNIYSIGGIPGRYFYSSRVGEFDTGVNLYGKLNPRDSIGVLAALDLGRRADWILRGRHEFGPTSNVNIGLVNRDDERLTNRVLELGEDFRRDLWGLDASTVISWLDGRRTGSAGNAFLYYQSPRWFAQLAPHFVSPGFRDDLGFIPFVDYRGVSAQLSYFTEWRKGPLRSFSTRLNANHSDHYDGRVFRRQREAFVNFQTRSDYAFGFGWDGGRFEEFDDSVFRLELRARVSDPFHNYGLGYSWGRRAGAPITFITPSVTWRFGEKLTVGVASALLFHTEDEQQHIVTFNYDFSPERGIGGRLVAQTGGTNAYFAYRRSGYGGVETFFILGDPNATRFRRRIMTKVIWPM